MKKEKRKKDSGTYALFNALTVSKKQFIPYCILNCITVALNIGSALIYGEFINMVSRGESMQKIGIGIGLAVLYTVIMCFLYWFQFYWGDKYYAKGLVNAQCQYMSKILGAKYSQISENDSSKYLSNIQNDLSTVQWGYVDCFVWGSAQTSYVIGTFIAAIALNWKIALTMLGFTVIMAILPFFIKKKLDQSSLELSKAKKGFMGVLKEQLLGVSIIKSFSAEKVAENDMKEEGGKVFMAARRRSYINSYASGLGNMIRQLSVVSLIGLTCYFVSINEVEIGAVLSIFSIGSQFYGGILGVSAAVTQLGGTKGLYDSVNEVYKLDNSPYPEKTVDFKESLVFSHVSFAYKKGERKVLEDVCVSFEKNKKYLVLGKSGSGKSTLLKLIAKYYDDYEGKILLDGTDYKNYSEKEASSFVAIAQQNCYLFNRTLRRNIDYLQLSKEEEFERAVKFSELQDFIELLPDGVESVVDEEVNQVSGGEKLRINLARALYRNSDILLLDEVTSALDKKTAEKVERNLLSIADKTLINVCHKFNDSTLSGYDKICIIENGKIVREGDFQSLKDDEKLLTYRNTAK